MADEHSTFPEDAPPIRVIRRARFLRRVGLAAMVVAVGLGLAGVFGVRMTTVSGSGEGYELSVTYARVSRSGLSTPLTIDVRRDGGFEGPVTVGITRAYLEIFDHNVFVPQPSSATTEGPMVLYGFDPPPGDRLTVHVDARLEPAFHLGREAVTAVYEEGAPVVTVEFSTRVMP